MRTPSALALLCLMAAAPARAAQVTKSPDCLPFPDKGCYYDPGIQSAEAPLLIYLRGHLSGNGVITGKDAVLASARQAFERYGLRAAAQSQGWVVLVTGSSHLPVLQEDVARLEGLLGRRIGNVAVAAHSGGYVGLSKSLDSLARVDRLVLLDDFYGDVAGMAKKIARRGAPCSGFYTPHNSARFKDFKGTSCAIEYAASDAEHDPRVGNCLPSYLAGAACDGKPPASFVASGAPIKQELQTAEKAVTVLAKTQDLFGPERKDDGTAAPTTVKQAASWTVRRTGPEDRTEQGPGARTLSVKEVPKLSLGLTAPAGKGDSAGWWAALKSSLASAPETPSEKWKRRLGEEARRWLDSGKEDSPAFAEAMADDAAALEWQAAAARKAERLDEAVELEALVKKVRRAAAGDRAAFAELASY